MGEIPNQISEKQPIEKKINNPEILNQIPEIRDVKENSIEKKNILTEDIMENISYFDFLKHPENQRLKAITNPRFKSIDLERNIKSGEDQEVEFKFSFNGKLNKNLLKKTTAGEVLPSIVRKIKNENGEIFIRKGNSGEFFNLKNERLKIYDQTKIIVLAEASKNYDGVEEKQKIQEQISKINKQNPEAIRNPVLIKKAIEKGIEPNFILLVFGKLINSLFSTSKDKVSLAENFVTDVSRIAGNNRISQDIGENGNIATNLALLVMKKYSGKNNFKKDAESYGIKEDEVKSFEFTENYNSRAEFYKLAKQKAKRVEEIYGVPWEITFGQSILESGHGESSRAKKQFNFFGHTNNKKDNLSLDNGVNNNFVIYNSIEDGFMAHGKFLRKYSRYNKAFIYTGENKNPGKFLDTIIDAGYVHINQSQYKETIRSILKSRGIII